MRLLLMSIVLSLYLTSIMLNRRPERLYSMFFRQPRRKRPEPKEFDIRRRSLAIRPTLARSGLLVVTATSAVGPLGTVHHTLWHASRSGG